MDNDGDNNRKVRQEYKRQLSPVRVVAVDFTKLAQEIADGAVEVQEMRYQRRFGNRTLEYHFAAAGDCATDCPEPPWECKPVGNNIYFCTYGSEQAYCKK